MSNKPLLLKALNKEIVDRPPVWLMRQAGRYLPEYMVLREKYDFFTRVETPEIATEITMQPMRRIKPDAAIIFSDILVIPKAMGMDVQLVPKVGPVLDNPIRSIEDVKALQTEGLSERLDYMYKALSLTRSELQNDKALIGFAGAPWTLFCYMIEGHGSKTFSKAKAFLYKEPEASRLLFSKLEDAIIDFLQKQVKAGADAVKLFDSWSGLLSPQDFQEWILPGVKKIVASMQGIAPIIVFEKGSWYALNELSNLNCALAVDWTMSPKQAREWAPKSVLQGNMDPSMLFSKESSIKNTVKQMIDEFGTQNYIANLGHGLMPDIPVNSVQAFVDAVKSY